MRKEIFKDYYQPFNIIAMVRHNFQKYLQFYMSINLFNIKIKKINYNY